MTLLRQVRKEHLRKEHLRKEHSWKRTFFTLVLVFVFVFVIILMIEMSFIFIWYRLKPFHFYSQTERTFLIFILFLLWTCWKRFLTPYFYFDEIIPICCVFLSFSTDVPVVGFRTRVVIFFLLNYLFDCLFILYYLFSTLLIYSIINTLNSVHKKKLFLKLQQNFKS